MEARVFLNTKLELQMSRRNFTAARGSVKIGPGIVFFKQLVIVHSLSRPPISAPYYYVAAFTLNAIFIPLSNL